MGAEFWLKKGLNMRATNWTAQTDSQTAARRAGGRRRYNAWRRLLAHARLGAVVKELNEVGFSRGYQSEIARRLGVHRSTVHRDFKKFALAERGYYWEEIELVSQTWHRWPIERR